VTKNVQAHFSLCIDVGIKPSPSSICSGCHHGGGFLGVFYTVSAEFDTVCRVLTPPIPRPNFKENYKSLSTCTGIISRGFGANLEEPELIWSVRRANDYGFDISNVDISTSDRNSYQGQRMLVDCFPSS
jgi:hypothetical protein